MLSWEYLNSIRDLAEDYYIICFGGESEYFRDLKQLEDYCDAVGINYENVQRLGCLLCGAD